jgi:electron-transferring-flavoprotein dehydrogenase
LATKAHLMAEHRQANGVRPSQHQPPLPRERLIVAERPGEDAVPMDVVIVGGGPAGLACAIELARLAKETGDTLEIGVLEKAGQLGEHSLSGAVVNPRAFHELFPGIPDEELPFRRKVTGESVYMLTEGRSLKIPTPPTMKNHGNWIGSICEIVRWMGERAEAAGVNVFAGFPVDSLLVDGMRVIGVRTTPKGLDRNGNLSGPDAQPPMDLGARVTVLAEGTRGPLSQAWLHWQNVKAENPQIFALGVKELWETKVPLHEIVHTMGWPLPTDVFGGSFMYPLEDNLVALGLVAGLDYKDARFDVHETFQRMKLHPLFRKYLEGGELLEWGAKTIPEGGFYSVPERRHGDGLVVVGDAAGYVDVPSLKGIHYAVHSGMLAARAIHAALRKDDVSQAALRPYSESVDASYVMRDLKSTRNMRLAFKHGFYGGGIRAGLMTITGGAFPGSKVDVLPDAAEPRRNGPVEEFTPDGKLTFSKVDAVFKSGNQTRDDIPSHLIVGQDVPPRLAELYVHMCPAGVYEKDGDKLVVNAPNCIDCKATDVLGPRWTPREGGSGPQYRRM